MKTPVVLLETIKRADVPGELYGKILERIEFRKRTLIQPVWPGVAAAVFVCLIATELYFVSHARTAQRTDATESIVQIPNHMLYE